MRDHSGQFKCLFFFPIPLMDQINQPEVLLHRALKISIASNLVNHHELIIESDSANDIVWCNGVNRGSMEFLLPPKLHPKSHQIRLKDISHQ